MIKKSTPSNCQVNGVLFHGYTNACVNLNIIGGLKAQELIEHIDLNGWYQLDDYLPLEQYVLNLYQQPDIIFEQVGEEMMKAWYHHGPGKNLIDSGCDFLNFQAGTQGYKSLVNGNPDQIGEFNLIELDIDAGTAVVESTTPFNKSLEKGILYGGMLTPGDITYAAICNREHPNRFQIHFHRNCTTMISTFFDPQSEQPQHPALSVDDSKDIAFYIQGLRQKQKRNHAFWQASNSDLQRSYEKLDMKEKHTAKSSYLSGKSETVIDFVHNAGNLINSVNLSLNSSISELHHSSLDKLEQTNDLFKELITVDFKESLDPDMTQIINTIQQYYCEIAHKLSEEQQSCLEALQRSRQLMHGFDKLLKKQEEYIDKNNSQEVLNISEIIEESLTSPYSPVPHSGIEVIRHYNPAKTITVHGKKERLIYALYEIYKNATDAMPPACSGSRLHISISNQKESIQLSIRDHGPGIAEEALNQVFNVDYSTKPEHHGFGFGLHNCANYLHEMGATIRAANWEHGAEITITFPC